MLMSEIDKSREKVITELYSLDIWPMDPRSEEGRKRFEEAKEQFKKLLTHEWIKKLIEKKEVRILEICAGTGIGGVALSRVLLDAGVNVKLMFTDIRNESLKVAEEWGKEELGIEVKVRKIDATKIHLLEESFDLVLMYGHSAPHFDPWDMIKLMASISSVLVDDGVFIMEEGDRIYSIFYLQGYKRVLPERVSERNIILSAHSGYDLMRGTFRRAYIEILGGRIVEVATYFWNIAELMALSWIFFKDVDFFRIRGTSGFILAYKPRRKIKIDDLSELPKILKR